MILLDSLISVTLELSTFFQDARCYDTIGGFNGVLASFTKEMLKCLLKTRYHLLRVVFWQHATGELGQHL